MNLFRNKLLFSLTAILMLAWLLNPGSALAVTTIGANISTDGYLKIGTSVPGSPVNGMIYYDSGSNKFRCYENGGWTDCISGVSGTIAIANGGTGQTSKTAAFDALAPTSATGDLIYNNGANNVRLPIGSANDILTVAGGVPTWAASTPLVITNTYVEGFLDSNPGNDCVSIAGAQIGDVCIVTGAPNKSYICANATCALSTDWKELLTSSAAYFAIANNFSELTAPNKPTARTNLGLGTTDTPNFEGLDFTPGAPPAYSEGRLYYDSTLKSLSYYNDQSTVPVNIGQKNILRVENNSGGAISYGQVVYISGAGTGGIPAVDLAKADSVATSKVLGFAAENIANGSQGYITAYGMLTGLNTAVFTAGDPVFLSSTVAGAITATRPVQPNYEVPVGYIGKSGAADGTILAFVVPKLSTQVTPGGVPFGNPAGYLIDDSTNLFWDNTLKYLGIGTNAPGYALDVRGDIKAGNGSLVYLGTNNGVPASAPAVGAMYYDTGSNKFKCYDNTGWVDCDTTGGTTTLQTAYNSGATITTAGSSNINFALAGGDFTASGIGSVNLTPTGASSFTSAGALTLTGGATSTWGTSLGDLNLAVNGAATGNVQIGSGTPSTAPDLLVLDNKTDAEGALAGTKGAMYYNASTNKFRCYENTGWTDCISVSAAPILSSITAATAANSINNDNNDQTWNWSLTTPSKIGFKFGENTASTGAGSVILESSALATSTATPLQVVNQGTAPSFIVENQLNDTVPPLYIQPAGSTPGAHNGHVAIGSNFFDPTNPEKLKVDSGNENSFNIISAGGDLNNYLQINIQNRNAGNNASSDVVATADNGDENSYYIDMGINSSNYNQIAYNIGGKNDAYILAEGDSVTPANPGGNLLIGTGVTGKMIKFYTGGSTSANEKMRIEDSGNVGIGTTSLNAKLDLAPATSDALRIEPYGVAAGNTGGLEFMELAANGSNYVGFKSPDSIAANKVWTLPNADGTAGQRLATDGSGTLSWVDPSAGGWQRVTTTLSPLTAGDNVTTSGSGTITSAGLLTGNAGLTINGGAASINDNSAANNTSINTGTSTGTVTIGSANAGAIGVTSGAALTLAGGTSSSFSTVAGNIKLQPAGSGTTGYVKIGEGQTGSTTPDILALDVTSAAFGIGNPAGSFDDGSMYYNEAANKFRCHVNGSWSDCDTTGGTPTLQLAYNGGATITTTGGVDIAFNLTNVGEDFNVSGNGAVNLTPTGALTLTAGAPSTWSTSAGALTITSAAGATWGTSAGDLTLRANSGVTNNVKIGNGGAGTNTPNLFAVDVKSTTGDPAGGYNGAMYYNQFDDVFRCYEAGGWKNCGSSAASATTLQQAYTAGPTISTSGSNIAFTLNTTDQFTASGAGSVNLTPTGASSFTTGAGSALTLTGGGASTWSTSAGALTVDSAAGLNLGTTNATGIIIGKAGITTTNIGTLQTGNAATAGNLKIADGSTNFITLTSPAIASDYTLTLPTTAGSSGQALTTNGSGTLSWASLLTDPMTARGDIIVRDATNTTARLPIGSAGYVLKSTGAGPDVAWAALTSTDVGLGNVTNDAQIPKAMGTAKGDLIAYTAANTPTNLPVGGTNGWVLQVDTSQATGMKWAANTVAANSLDFAQFSDAMTVDNNTSINLAGKNLTINDATGGGILNMSTNAAALTLTAGGASTWSTTAGALTINSGTTTPAGLNLGTAGTNAVSIGNSGSTFALTSSGFNVSGNALTGVNTLDTIGTSATALTFAGAGTINSNTTNALTLDSGTSGDVNLGTGATAKNIKIGNATGATNVNILAGSNNVTIGTSDATGTLLVLDTKTGAGDPTPVAGGMYYNSSEGKFKCYEAGSWKNCISAGSIGLQDAYNVGATITTAGGNAVTITTPIGSNNAGLVIQQNNTTNNPVALQLTNAGTGNDITATNWSVTKAGNLSTSGNVTTTGTGIITSAGLLTGQLGLTVTGAAVSLNSGITAASNFSTSINEGTSTGTVTIGNSAAGAISVTSGAALALVGAPVNINTTGTGATSIGNGTGVVSLTLGSDATGDIYYRNSSGNLTRLGVGSNGNVLTLATGLPSWASPAAGSLSALTAATATNSINNANFAQTWNWSLTGATNGLNLTENSASSGTGYILNMGTLATSTAKPLKVTAQGNTIIDTTNTGGITLGNTTANTAITLQSGTGAISIGTDANAHTITIGSSSSTAVKIGTLGTQDGIVYTSAADGTLAQTAAGTSGQFLKSNGSGSAPTWADAFVPKIAQVYADTTQAISTLGGSVITFNQNNVLDASNYTLTSNHVTFNVGGYYRISYNISSKDSVDSRENVKCVARKNTTAITQSTSYSYGRNTTDAFQTNTATFYVNAASSDYIDVLCSLPGSIYTANTIANESWMTLEFVR